MSFVRAEFHRGPLGSTSLEMFGSGSLPERVRVVTSDSACEYRLRSVHNAGDVVTADYWPVAEHGV